MELKQFVNRHNVKMTAELIDERPDKLMDDMVQGSTHWKCVLTRLVGYDGPDFQNKVTDEMTVYFSQGPAISKEPTVENLLDCIASDASSVEGGGRSFEDWAFSLGYDPDSRQAERIYKAIERQREDLLRLFTNEELETLLFECERL